MWAIIVIYRIIKSFCIWLVTSVVCIRLWERVEGSPQFPSFTFTVMPLTQSAALLLLCLAKCEEIQFNVEGCNQSGFVKYWRLF